MKAHRLSTGADLSEHPCCPHHIWRHEVVVIALRAGAKPEHVAAVLDAPVTAGGSRASLWWRSHETSEGAAATLIAWCREMARARVDAP